MPRPSHIPHQPEPRAFTARGGQAMVESIIVLFFLCVIFFLVFDYARLLICHTTLDYAEHIEELLKK